MATEQQLKRIKKNLYGKPQSIIATFPSGFSEVAEAEVRSILATLWFERTETPQITVTKKYLRVDEIHLFAVMELMLRSYCLSDMRLLICDSKAVGKSAFLKKCEKIDWECYLPPNAVVKIRVNSVASRAFHETALRELLQDLLVQRGYVIVAGLDAVAETTLSVEYYLDRLTISFSLAGLPLYQRQYRGVLSASAPLREDIAAAALRRGLQFARDIHPAFQLEQLWVPFAGTGTFVFECLMLQCQLVPALFRQAWAIQTLPFFRAAHFHYVMKQAVAHVTQASLRSILTMDHTETAVQALQNNLQQFTTLLTQQGVDFPTVEMQCETADFFTFDGEAWLASRQPGHLFLPLNPPYGIRFARQQDVVQLYKTIAKKIAELAVLQRAREKCVAGFVLCPTEEIWRGFCGALGHAKVATYHFLQGGLDIRVCQFVLL